MLSSFFCSDLELLEEIRKMSRYLENIHDRASMFYGKFPSRAKKPSPSSAQMKCEA